MYDQATKGGKHTWQAEKMHQLCVYQCYFLSWDHMVKKQGEQLLFVASAQLLTGTVFLSVY